MSLKPHCPPPVPEQTARIARAAFPKGNPYLRMRDEFGLFYTDELFADLFPNNGQPAFAPWRLALITVMQAAEGLSDRQAADAVRSRLDWKYALSLELEDSGFNFSILSEFRTRLVKGQCEQVLFETMLGHFKARGLVEAGGNQRTDSTHVLAKIRALNRLEGVHETLRAALNVLSVVVPQWLREHTPNEWYTRYDKRLDEFRLPPKGTQRDALARIVGQDGAFLLEKIYTQKQLEWLSQLEAVETLRQVWVQQYQVVEGAIEWRSNENIASAGLLISSPYDVEARYAKKGTLGWTGYKVHLSESCDEGLPHLLTHVETSVACKADEAATPIIHDKLKAKQLLPAKHIVDTGYLDSQLIVETERDYKGLSLIGPMRGDYKWQARAGEGFDAASFTLDWQAQSATCPNGKLSSSWSEAIDKRKNEVIKIKFAHRDCKECPVREKCTRSKMVRRTITIRPQTQYEVIQRQRLEQHEVDFKRSYAQRAGVEGTISQGVRAFGLRRSRYIGQAKTHLQHCASAAAINLVRTVAWLEERPLSKTRTSHFAALQKAA